MSAPALAEQLEVSTRTVMRDLEALGAAGVPIFSVRGPQGGYELWGGFRLELTGLTVDEVRGFLLLGLPLAADVFGLGDAGTRTKLKVLRSLPEELAASATDLDDEVHHDPLAWDTSAPMEALRFLATSIRARRVVVGRDITGGGYGRTVILQPLGLVLKAGHWYLVGTTGAEVRVLEVDQFTDLANTGGRFDRPSGFRLSEFWAQWVIDAAER